MDSDGSEARQTLRELPSLRALGNEALELLLRLGTAIHHERERVLAYQGEKPDRVFLVVRGRVRLLKYCSDDTCVVLTDAAPGEWVGLTEAALACPSLANAAALPGSDVLAFSLESLRRIRTSPALTENLFTSMARTAYRLHLRIEENTPLPRLARFLLEHATPGEGAPTVRATQDQIAEAIGVTRETVNRHLQQLQSDLMVVLGRGTIEIVDAAELGKRLLV